MRLVRCQCCKRLKERDLERACKACRDAACRFSYGNWFRGEQCPRSKRNARHSETSKVVRAHRRAHGGTWEHPSRGKK
jgi:hypothetical protein